MEHYAVFLYKLLNIIHFCHTIPILFNGDFYGYFTRSRNNRISANPLPIENGAAGRQLILVQKSRTD